MEEEEFKELVKKEREFYDQNSRESAKFQFAEALKKIKGVVENWEANKKKEHGQGSKNSGGDCGYA